MKLGFVSISDGRFDAFCGNNNFKFWAQASASMCVSKRSNGISDYRHYVVPFLLEIHWKLLIAQKPAKGMKLECGKSPRQTLIHNHSIIHGNSTGFLYLAVQRSAKSGRKKALVICEQFVSAAVF